MEANILTYKMFLELVVWLNVSWSSLQSLSEDQVLAVVAKNNKGSSEPVVFKDLVFRDAAKMTGKSLQNNLSL